MEILGKLFGNVDRVKIIRLFISNSDQVYDKEDVMMRAKTNRFLAKHEIMTLEKIGLIKRKSGMSRVQDSNNNSRNVVKMSKKSGWALNPDFIYLKELQNLLVSKSLFKSGDIIKKFEGLGKIKLILVAGVFVQDFDSRVDLLIVGDNLKSVQIKNAINVLESEIGKEIRYAIFDTLEFKYRIGMCDKLIRDILDYHHEKVVDKLSFNTGVIKQPQIVLS